MERLLFEDWRGLVPGQQDTAHFAASCGGAPLLVSGVCEDTAASDLRFLDALLPQLADGGGAHDGWAGACGEPCGDKDSTALPRSCGAHGGGGPPAAGHAAAAQGNANAVAPEDVGPPQLCLDSRHPSSCMRCKPAPCAEDAPFFYLRGSKGACHPSAARRPTGCPCQHTSRLPSAVRETPSRAAAPTPPIEARTGARRRAVAVAACAVARAVSGSLFHATTSAKFF
jgi:hypothetical protein